MPKPTELEQERIETLYEIHDERSDFEAMVQRARIAGDPLSDDFVNGVLTEFDKITQVAQTAQTPTELESASNDADLQGQLRAYVCPLNEIEEEGKHCIDLIEEWNVPASVLRRLRGTVLPKLKAAASKPEDARSALRTIYQEHDSWDRYTVHYEDKMRKFSRMLGLAVFVLVGLAITCFLFPKSFLVGLVFAGMAGGCVSVLSKMPFIEVELTGALESYERRVVSRVTVGTVASLIGSGLMGWGVINLSAGNMNFSEAVSVCSTGSAPCTPLNILVLLCVPLLFGFSERALTSFERQFGKLLGQNE
jgi:hypothetical protein